MEIIISLLDSVLLPYIFLKLDKIHGEMRRRRNNEENTVQILEPLFAWQICGGPFFQWYRLRIIGYLTNFAYNILYAMGANANIRASFISGLRVVRRRSRREWVCGTGTVRFWQSVNGKPSSWKDGLVRALQLSAIASIAAFKVTEWAYSPEVQRAFQNCGTASSGPRTARRYC